MAWFSGKVSLGNLDFAGAVNKLSEGVKTIEKNFDNALGIEENPDGESSTSQGLWSTDLMSFMGQKEEEEEEDDDNKSSENLEPLEKNESLNPPTSSQENEMAETNVETLKPEEHQETNNSPSEEAKNKTEMSDETDIVIDNKQVDVKRSEEVVANDKDQSEVGPNLQTNPSVDHVDQDESTSSEDQVADPNEVKPVFGLQKTEDEVKTQKEEETMREVSEGETGNVTHQHEAQSVISDVASIQVSNDAIKEDLISVNNEDSVDELEKVKREMKMMETALFGAATQAQTKADEIEKLMNGNEHLKSLLESQMRKANEAEIESQEFHQKVSTLERKVYALTRERDTLRREQNKKSDAAALLKEKDEIITQVMAEGENLSKKQAAQESQIRKLRAQIREFEEEKKGLITKLQVEENKVESLKRDKLATENLLQETIEKNQAELSTQKEFYTNALNLAKEAEAIAQAQANNEARTELELKLKESEERETMLVQTLEELRQTLSRKEQQAVFREDMLRRDVEDLQKRYQASERRCEELITQVPDSTRPLLRQIEAMQETTSRRAEAWNAVERSLTSRLQEAETKAAASEEKERSMNERLSQTLSRINVLEAQISCLRSEQTQLTKSLEKERQKAGESRQDYLALKEEADTHEGHVTQLLEEIKELKRKHKDDLQEALTHRQLLQQDIEREKAARVELEKTANLESFSEQNPIVRRKSNFENDAGLTRGLSSANSLSSMEESYYLQASLDSSDTLSERRNTGEPSTMSSYYLKSKTPNAFEAALRQKEGELASYMSRLASMESIRDSLADELVKMTAECEKLRSEVSQLPGMKAELEALRQRHSAALELMGERDEELEELRADIVDLKEMYREQVNILVNKIQKPTSSIGAAA